MKKIFPLVVFTMMLAAACSDLDTTNCIKGTVIGIEQCSNALLIEVQSNVAIGETLTYYDHVTFNNVVRVQPLQGFEINDPIYFTFRTYNHPEDYTLFESGEPCLAVYTPFQVPTIVITSSSSNSCDESMPC